MMIQDVCDTSPVKMDRTDKDKQLRLMKDILKSNQKHIEHLKQTVEALKKQVNFEQNWKEEVLKENEDLKKIITQLKDRVTKYEESAVQKQTQPELQFTTTPQQEQKLEKQVSSQQKELPSQPILRSAQQSLPVPQIKPMLKINLQNDNSNVSNQDFKSSPPKEKVSKTELKINVRQVISSTRNVDGPQTNVKKSQMYIEELQNQKLAQAMKESIVMLSEKEKAGRGSNALNSSSLYLKKSNSVITQFNFCIPEEGSQMTRSMRCNQQIPEEDESNSVPPQPNPSVLFMNDSLSPELQLQKTESTFPTQNQNGLRLFENFYILGCKGENFFEFDQDQNVDQAIVPAQIQFKYSFDKNCAQNQYEYIIHEFAYPFGIKAEKLKSDAQRKLKEIIYSGNKYELLDKFFLFTMKNQQEQSNLAPFESEVLDTCNSEYILYGICLSVYDYIESSIDKFNPKKRTFWKFKKTYCFITYFPFFEFFQDILIQLINTIKLQRIQNFLQKGSQENEVLSSIDGEKIISLLRVQTEDLLKSLQSTKSVPFDADIQMNTEFGQVKYRVYPQEQIHIQLRIWSVGITIQLLNYRQLIAIFLAIMQEISVVFICPKISVLTAVMHFFHNIILPIKWSHPIIYSLPESLLPILESPVPILVGININELQFQELDIESKCDNLMIVFVDFQVKIITKPITLLQNVKTPYFDGNLINLEKCLKDPIKLRNPSPCTSQPQQKRLERKELKFTFDDKDIQVCHQVLRTFQLIIQKYLIDKMPKELDPSDVDTNIKLKKIEKYIIDHSSSKDRDFIRAVLKTQLLNFFLQEFYGLL